MSRTRSGCCYDETYPEMHALCSGRFSDRDGPTSSPEERVCACRCHTPEGAHLRRGRSVVTPKVRPRMRAAA